MFNSFEGKRLRLCNYLCVKKWPNINLVHAQICVYYDFKIFLNADYHVQATVFWVTIQT